MEIRAVDDSLGTFSGIASAYDVIDSYGTVVGRGAFDKSVANHKGNYPLLWQHDATEPIGSFRVIDTVNALEIEGSFCLDTVRGREAYSLLKAGAIKGISIGFNVVSGEPAIVDGRDVIRYTEVDLWEVSVVTFASNPEAEVKDVRSMEIPTPENNRSIEDLDDDTKEIVAKMFEDCASKIREGIGKVEEEPATPAEEPEPEPEPEPEDKPDDEEQRAIDALRSLRAVLEMR